MVDDPTKNGGPPLPPKLDLRKSGILKDAPEKSDKPNTSVPAAQIPTIQKLTETTKPIEAKPAAQTPIAAPKPPSTPKPPEAVVEKPAVTVAPKPVAPVAAVKPASPVAPQPATPAAPQPVAAVKPVAPVAPKPVFPTAPKPVAAVQPIMPLEPKSNEQAPGTEAKAPNAPIPAATVAAVKPAVPAAPQPATPAAPKPVIAVKPAVPVAPKPIAPATPQPVAAIQPIMPLEPKSNEQAPGTEAKVPNAPIPAAPVAAVKPASPVAPRPTVLKPAVPQPSPAKPTIKAKPVSAVRPAMPDDPSLKSETMRITLHEKPAVTTPITPKPVLVKPAAQAQPQQPEDVKKVSSKTIRLDNLTEAPSAGAPDSTSPVTTEDAAAQQAGEMKKETSKIPLEEAKAAPIPITQAQAPGTGPKTVILKPKTISPNTIGGPKPAVPKPAAPQPVVKAEDKSKTSRISLDAAMSADSAPGAASAPKTIRLKKPSEAGTIKVTKPPAGQDARSKTAALDEAATESDPSPTRKKTIKVKRPTQSPAIKTGPRVGAPATADAGTPADELHEGDVVPAGGGMPVIFEQADRPNVFFHIWASLSIIVTIVAIILFYSQALGTNSCLTQFSWNKDWPTVNWPGKIPMSDRYR